MNTHTHLPSSSSLYHLLSLSYSSSSAEKDDKQLKREQIAKLRAALYSLQQKKQRSQSDEQLLQQISQRLRMLTSS